MAKAVKRITNNKGVNVIYDPIAGKNLEVFADIIAPTGAIILYGVLDLSPITFPLFPLLIKGANVHPYNVFDFTGLPSLDLPIKSEAVERAKAFIVNKLKDGSLKPVIAKTFALDEVADDHRFMESNEQVGKIVVTIN